MKPLLDFCWRLGLRFVYPLARLYWFWLRPDVRGTYVFVWCNGRALLTRNSYRRGLVAPGGMVRRGEEPLRAAVRELAEETGIAVEAGQLKPLGEAPKRRSNGYGTAEMFEVVLGVAPPVAIDNREVVWAGFMRPEEALAEDLDFVTQVYLEGVLRTGPPGPIDSQTA